MANRNATAAVLAELAAGQSSPCHLVEVYRDAGTTYLTDAFRSIAWEGNTYTAQGQLLAIEGLGETLDLQIGRVSVTLSGDDDDRVWVAAVLSEEWVGRRLVVRKAFLDDAGAVILDPLPLFDGHIDDVDVTDELEPNNGTTRVTVHAAPEFSDFTNRPGRHTSDAEQQKFFPGDKFFEHVSAMARTMTWGGGRVRPGAFKRFRGGRRDEEPSPESDARDD